MTIDAPGKIHISQLKALWYEAFGDTDTFISGFFSTAFHPDRCRCLLKNDAVAAALYWFDCLWNGQKIAYLYAVATAKSHRGHGLCHALMSDTHRHLASLGYVGAILVPGSPELFSFYAKMGYQVCGYVRNFSCIASSETVPIRPVSAEEYAPLRRRFLPENAVIQERENLAFLQTYAALYAGSDFLLAACGDGETLCVSEILGDTHSASAIVHTLGFSQGTFRAPGDIDPFAMYFPLDPAAVPPAYFGLAFD